MKKIDFNNAIINGFVKIERWVKANLGYLDDELRFFVGGDKINWDVIITKDCLTFITPNGSLGAEYGAIRVDSGGVWEHCYVTNGWSHGMGKWETDEVGIHFGLDGMYNTIDKWGSLIKPELEKIIEKRNKLINFEA